MSPRLADAVGFAESCEARMPVDLSVFMAQYNESEGADGAITGPLLPRGPSTGVVIHRGARVAAWGRPEQVGVSFSLTKAFLSALAGIAVADGLVRIDERAGVAVPGPLFEGSHNAAVTWRQLLQLTSEWHGTLFGKPDAVDWHRVAGGPAPADTPPKGSPRALQPPGTHWEYNDVRMNVLALALLHVFERALPQVLRERLMDPIGASHTWTWHGYENSFVEVAGQRVQSVAAGAHWGGGMFVSAGDLALLGQLYLQRGRWQDQSLLAPEWIDFCTAPGPLNVSYGALWWLNRGAAFAGLSPRSYWAGGLGGSLLWIDPDHELVVVTRWIEPEQRAEVLRRIVGAIEREQRGTP